MGEDTVPRSGLISHRPKVGRLARPYRCTEDCIRDLDKTGQLIRVQEEVSPYLEMAELTRRVYKAGGPALLFEQVSGTPFRSVSNLFGTVDRGRYIFRKTLSSVKAAVRFKADVRTAFTSLKNLFSLPLAALHSLPIYTRSAPVLACETTVSKLPQIVSWPLDGGAFITLPQVLSEDPEEPGLLNTNLGMYRIQLSGNDYQVEKEVGLHYQIHRGIGIHHAKAIKQNHPLKVCIFVGGPPAHTFAAVMPLPEGLSEVIFAGMLAGRNFRFKKWRGYQIAAEADFCLVGTIDPYETKPEGPFGDHLGYYSLTHDFPYMKVEKVFHRKNAIWPFTVVGRPPQEDTTFGRLIHEISSPMVPVEIPGLKELHAVDEAGVHPLLLAIGSERYVPYRQRIPMELLTQANAILGFNQCSLAKYLLIVAEEDKPDLSTHEIEVFFVHLLERIDLTRDIHFQTRTTIDTLDYSSQELNFGSKVVFAAAGPKIRELATEIPQHLSVPFEKAKMVMPGVCAVGSPTFSDDYDQARAQVKSFCAEVNPDQWRAIPLIVLVDDVQFCTADLANFLWLTFTRSNPSEDIYGVQEFVENKHWGTYGSLVIDARFKPHNAPPLIESEAVNKRVDQIIDNNPQLDRLLN